MENTLSFLSNILSFQSLQLLNHDFENTYSLFMRALQNYHLIFLYNLKSFMLLKNINKGKTILNYNVNAFLMDCILKYIIVFGKQACLNSNREVSSYK